MSQFFFAVHDGQFGKKLKNGRRAAKRMDKIAKSVDKHAGYEYWYMPAENRYYGHGYCRNLGSPFDQATASAIEAAWREAGL